MEAGVQQRLRLGCLYVLSIGSNTKQDASSSTPTSKFTPEDFPHSKIGTSKGYNAVTFAKWAAENATLIANDLSHSHPELVLERLRKAYLKYQKTQKMEQAYKVNYRIDDNSKYIRSHIGLKIKDGSEALPEEATQIANFATVYTHVEESLGGFNSDATYLRRNWRFATNQFSDNEGNILESGFIMLHNESPSVDTIIYRAPGAWDAKPAFRNIMQRVNTLATSPWSKSSRAEWVKVMRGFFITMPFYSGTAGIGRVFFSALAAKMKGGGTIKLPADIDLYALTLNEADFASWCESTIFDREN
ncbi:MAG: hypothetical protein R3A80_09355 [Bdellovibrionota bacterium]